MNIGNDHSGTSNGHSENSEKDRASIETPALETPASTGEAVHDSPTLAHGSASSSPALAHGSASSSPALAHGSASSIHAHGSSETSLPQTEASALVEDLALDSSYFVAFEMTHDALKRGLDEASDLSVTQYRVLVKLLGASPAALQQTTLKALLNLKPNVVTQAVNALEKAGFAERTQGEEQDGRTRAVRITAKGEQHIAHANDSIVEQLYTLFPTKNATYKSLLEASITAGAAIDPPLSQDVASRYFASRTLVSLELVRKALESALRETCGASFPECRVMQRLGEINSPARPSDLARQLRLPPASVARAADALVARGWVQRLASPIDHKAVYLKATKEGKRQQHVIAATLNLSARKHMWGKLDEQGRRAVISASREVIGDQQRKDEAARLALLNQLQPL